VMLQEDRNAPYGLRKVWECELKGQAGRSRGGNIQRLTDGSVFISGSSPGSDLLVVDSAREVIWNGRVEKWDATQQSWTAYPTYRASMVASTHEIQNMILYRRESSGAENQ